jgi:D-3-phosphoglycerate dehydrogenase
MAAVDVYEDEPVVDPEDPLLRLNNAPCTPHLGYMTVNEWELQFADIFDQINAHATGRPINLVNPEVLTQLRPIRAHQSRPNGSFSTFQ